jgi:hypothetical protein
MEMDYRRAKPSMDGLHPVTSPLPAAWCAALLSSFAFALGNTRFPPPASLPLSRLLCDVQLRVGNHRALNLLLATDADIGSATFATLMFTTQKNGVRGEDIGLSCS